LIGRTGPAVVCSHQSRRRPARGATHAVNTRAIDLTEALLLLSRAGATIKTSGEITPTGRRRAVRHGATPRRAAAHRQMTVMATPMARPGLEPGTPRFSVAANGYVFRAEIPVNKHD
jgi:hypothetical protein